MAKDSHSITGEHSWYLESFELPDHDVDTTMRNFPGYEKDCFYDMDDIREGDWAGATDTDYNSHVHEHEEKTKDHSRSPSTKEAYTNVYETHGTQGNRFKFKTSSPRMADNLNKKPVGIKSPLKSAGVRKKSGPGKD